jgi:septal ring factor EnvC (AmiA/AmiB activator)
MSIEETITQHPAVVVGLLILLFAVLQWVVTKGARQVEARFEIQRKHLDELGVACERFEHRITQLEDYRVELTGAIKDLRDAITTNTNVVSDARVTLAELRAYILASQHEQERLGLVVGQQYEKLQSVIATVARLDAHPQ